MRSCKHFLAINTKKLIKIYAFTYLFWIHNSSMERIHPPFTYPCFHNADYLNFNLLLLYYAQGVGHCFIIFCNYKLYFNDVALAHQQFSMEGHVPYYLYFNNCNFLKAKASFISIKIIYIWLDYDKSKMVNETV